MSALGLDDRKNPGGVLHYAPRRLRAVDDETTIRPVLERLSRGEGRTPTARMIRKGGVAAMPPVDFEAAARNSLPMAARLAVAGGVVALMAALGAGVFIWPRMTGHAAASTTGAAPSAAATTLPTPVHTVSIRQGDDARGDSLLTMIDKNPARAPKMAPIVSADAGAAAAPAQSAAGADPAASPLKLWAMMPADTAPPGWTPAGQQAMDQAAPVDKAAAPKAAPPPHKTATVRHARHVVHHRKWHRRRRVATAPVQAEAQAEPPAQTDQPQPIKKLPLQAAIDRIFNNGGGTGPAPATTP